MYICKGKLPHGIDISLHYTNTTMGAVGYDNSCKQQQKNKIK